MKKHAIKRIEQEAKVYASVRVEGGGVSRQSYNSGTGETYPNRELVPLVLTPVVGYNIPSKGISVENAASMLTDGHWYRLDGTNSSGLTAPNEISNGVKLPSPSTADRYTINTTAGSATYGQLTIRENVDPGKSVTYVFVATLPQGKGRTVQVAFRTDNKVLNVEPLLQFDNLEEGEYNPWEDSKTWVITPHVVPSTYAATYVWETDLSGVWAKVGTDLLHWAVSVNATTGALTIDRGLMPDQVKLRCVATVTIDGAQTQVTRYVTHTRRLPWFEYDFEQPYLNEDHKTVSPVCVVTAAKGRVSDPGEELNIGWYDGAAKQIAVGEQPTIPLSAIGSGETEIGELGLEATDKGGYCALLDSDGSVLTDSDGAVLIFR